MKPQINIGFLFLVIWPIIVNAQAGTTFLFLGIDWKADDLDNTMFWIGVFGHSLYAMLWTVKDRLNKEKKKNDIHR
jgi:hypothetical protein